MSAMRSIAYAAMLGSMRRDARAFNATKDDLERIQRDRLVRLLVRNARTAFGRAHGFGQIKTFEDYQQAVPLTDYDALTPWIDRIAAGEGNILTADRVMRFVPSSGSAAATKLIPYTDSLRKEMHRAVAPWVASAYRVRPSLKRDRAYCTISPPTEAQDAHGVIPVGFADDEEYLGHLGRWAYRQLFISPGKVTPDLFHRVHAASLLAAEDLRLISVWSPTYLLSLFEQMRSDADAILADLRGAVSKKRLTLLARCVPAVDFAAIWPNLELVSCWTDGPSAAPARWLSDALPQAALQPKGLMATEAVVSVPVAEGVDPMLAYRSHVFEFIESDTARVLPPWEVQTGCRYEVVVTTAGGLYRYPLGDEVEITGIHHSLPTMRFVGKTSLVSDRCGEKLNAAFVSNCFDTLRNEGLLDEAFAMLAPSLGDDRSLKYKLFYCSASGKRGFFLSDRLEELLSDNYHYRNCRQLKQLSPVQIVHLAGDPQEAMHTYQLRCQARGTPAGQVKFSSLSKLDGWESYFNRVPGLS
jgi:hypothetical protein